MGRKAEFLWLRRHLAALGGTPVGIPEARDAVLFALMPTAALALVGSVKGLASLNEATNKDSMEKVEA